MGRLNRLAMSDKIPRSPFGAASVFSGIAGKKSDRQLTPNRVSSYLKTGDCACHDLLESTYSRAQEALVWASSRPASTLSPLLKSIPFIVRSIHTIFPDALFCQRR